MKDDLKHRPWPLPDSPWVNLQRWHDLLFMHWPIPIASLKPFIPKDLSLDTFHGTAWIGIVPFHMSGIRLKCLPALPGISAFPELNVRTYVTDGKKPGVWFFSLDATNPLAVKLARVWYHLPYFHALMSIQTKEETFYYKSRRKNSKPNESELSIEYSPFGVPFFAQKDSIEYWLTERYCLYASSRGNRLYRAEIHHAPWKLQQASAKILMNSMAQSLPLSLPGTQPLLHFSRYQEAFIWNPQKL